MTIRAVIVDDESPARDLLQELLEAHDDVQVVGECANGIEAVSATRELSPDLLFLDIQMPQVDGFEVLELLSPDIRPAVIFTTAHDEFALKAFDVHAVDYLLKPFGAERLAAALERAAVRLSAGVEIPAEELAREARHRALPLERILIREEGRVHVVPVEKVDYVEAQGDGVVISVDGVVLKKSQGLGELELELDPGRFLRIHRSYLLNLDRLAGIELYAKDSRVAVLRDGRRIPLSRSGYARLRTLL